MVVLGVNKVFLVKEKKKDLLYLKGTQLKVKNVASGKLQVGLLFLMTWMAIFTNFKGSCLVGSKVLVGPRPLPWVSSTPDMLLLACGWLGRHHSSIRCCWAGGCDAQGHHQHMVYINHFSLLLIWIKSLSKIGGYLNIAHSPLYGCRCSVPAEVIQMLTAHYFPLCNMGTQIRGMAIFYQDSSLGLLHTSLTTPHRQATSAPRASVTGG